eukprot:CAMPEP_0178926840 /NCGR_PEP_ID=MMETSP0786-20121207/18786_1 /TAXON_ID=186022 /ORGANISM="Thalassionema frauenfeldii, Strain CCMP 1798" /LENGTH=240 /DNA_ID=CAMNT_0020602067 /DNA_START=29 /DNA_END=751 /DNA_ORIENTATION=+
MLESSSTEPPIMLNDYETKRAENIERNNARLRALGLISALEEKRSNALAWGRQLNTDDTDKEDEEDSDAEYKDDNVGKRKQRSKQIMEPSRKSRRLQGEEPETSNPSGTEQPSTTRPSRHEGITAFESAEERQARVEECRQARQRAALEVANAGAAAAAKNNPTATYDHCLMRVKTMTPKALENRVKVIERAAGKHCVVKMAIFKSCLQDEDMWELAKLASDALERLKALQPPPPKNEGN